jgi:hypothetical protein
MLWIRVFIKDQLHFIPVTRINSLSGEYGTLKYRDKPFSGIIRNEKSFYYVANGVRVTKSDFCKEIFGTADVNLPTHNNGIDSLKIEDGEHFVSVISEGLSKEELEVICNRIRKFRWISYRENRNRSKK